MRKSNKKFSMQGMKRAQKNLARKSLRQAELETHISFLYNILQGTTLDFNKLEYKTAINKLTGEQEKVYRNPKQTKYIINRLVSMGR